MFTGIIEEVGEVLATEALADSIRLTVRAPEVASDAARGDSIAVAGVCLTVVDSGPDWFTADVMRQTLVTSAIASVTAGRPVNLERAVRAHDRLGGHIVQGHVDGVGSVLAVTPGQAWSVVRVSLPEHLAPLVADKGSIAVNGTSLTVSAVSDADAREPWFEVSLIPETLTATTHGALAPGDIVNLETDVLARHVQRLLAFGGATAGLIGTHLEGVGR